MTTVWNLDVIYQGLEDPAYEADVKAFEEVVASTAEMIEKAKNLGDVEKVETLLLQEEKVFDLYMSGKTAREIMEIASIKERTIKFHNSNIYDKLGVKNMKELLRFATLYEKENGENI